MKNWLPRIILVLVAATIISRTLYKDHCGAINRPVVFFREAPGLFFKIDGNVEKPGIYKIHFQGGRPAVNWLTVMGGDTLGNAEKEVLSNLENGSHINVKELPLNQRLVTHLRMNARERVTLGLLLDPNALSAVEWEWLPGIGPKMAAAIVGDRQRNGGFSSYADLERVPGVGAGRLKQLEVYFVGRD